MRTSTDVFLLEDQTIKVSKPKQEGGRSSMYSAGDDDDMGPPGAQKKKTSKATTEEDTFSGRLGAAQAGNREPNDKSFKLSTQKGAKNKKKCPC